MERLKWTFIKEDTNCNYEVCSNGVIISKVNFPPTPVKTYEEEGGLKVRLHNIGGKHIKKYVHYVVAECFLPNPDNLPYVNHKDGNKWNNNVENLEWSAVNELKKEDEREEVTYTTPAPLYVPQEEDLKPKRGRKKKYDFKTRKEYFNGGFQTTRKGLVSTRGNIERHIRISVPNTAESGGKRTGKGILSTRGSTRGSTGRSTMLKWQTNRGKGH